MSRKQFFLRAFLASIFLTPALAQKFPVVCGGGGVEGAKEELFLHRQAAKSRGRSLRAAGDAGAPGKDYGDVAVMYDSGGVVAQRNPFLLQERTLRFVPAGAGYRYELAPASFDPDEAAAGTLIADLEDDDSREFALPFAFPFYGREWQDIFVNSNGNITFSAADPLPVTPSVGSFAGGAPRIGGVYTDLDPRRSLGGVRVLIRPGRVVVTFSQVPEYRARGTGPLQTFQLRLFPDGVVEIAFSEINAIDFVAGLSPGALHGGPLRIVSFGEESKEEAYTGAVVERYAGSSQLDFVLLSRRFYETHNDAYDYLVVYNTLGISASSTALANQITLRNVNRRGFGDVEIDVGADFGSRRRLQALIRTGPVSNYPRDPNAVVPLRSRVPDTPLTILGHEVGHLFLAFASIRDEADPQARPMLGTANVHWSFNFNSEASFVEGNRIRDNGATATPRFLTTGTVEGYSPLDQYLMGFRAPADVPPTFLVSGSGIPNATDPRRDMGLNGERVDIRVEDIIAAEGPRIPDHTVAQRRFRIAFVLLIAGGTEPDPAALDQVDTYRREFEPYFRRAASDRAFVDTRLRKALATSLWPAAGVVQGSSFNATIDLEQPAPAPITFALRTQNGAAQLPASVTIPAGATQAAFTVRGARAGVEEISVEPSDAGYMTDYARLQVLPSVAGLRLRALNSDALPAGPYQFRVEDSNLLPYPGVRVNATASPGSTLNDTSAIADANGVVRFEWMPGVEGTNELRVRIEGTPADAATVIERPGRPTIDAAHLFNAASWEPVLSPGQLTVMYGSNLGHAQIRVNRLPAPITYEDAMQLHFVVPMEVAPGAATVEVRSENGSTGAAAVDIVQAAPAVFADPFTNIGGVVIAGTGEYGALRGEFVEIYGTGFGAEPFETPRVIIGGVEAEVTYCGLAPGLPGIYQVNARVSPDTPVGREELQVEYLGLKAKPVLVDVRGN